MSSAANGRCEVIHAAQVCVTCKARKKRCDKQLPLCGYCTKKGLKCRYRNTDSVQELGHDAFDRYRSGGLLGPDKYVAALKPLGSEVAVHLEVHRAIREMGFFVDEVTSSYFQGLHRHLPFISRRQFHDDFTATRTTPSAGFSALVLSLSLVASSPRLSNRIEMKPPPARHSLYSATKSLLAQIQTAFPPTTQLIQAYLLSAIYEYAEGQPEEAFTTVATCIRMAYRLRIHLNNRRISQQFKETNHILSDKNSHELEYDSPTIEATNTCSLAFAGMLSLTSEYSAPDCSFTKLVYKINPY
ncbi:hypothetical protein CORC01_12770 [Colletotrichum orchidophilum]|uniref:Zn(2)-C6 fungal-type domain-containing protein n=1 Tax=Colletotrichum orchidophilum TaxID=1209926 RepID=A0A1G4ARY5_9PEZI|nr:uncharacterized protein CORC01_12770 [Colletotrichum orchidophilum]OHE91920.1 hypothetical protein CORC01_12770 [Colletotrichum orchidophilum]